MYAGRAGYGSQLPYGMGERVPRITTNLGEVSQSGYGPYLGNIFDDITKIATKVGVASNELSKVASGEATIATIPKGTATLTLPVGSTGVSKAVPLWLVGATFAGLAYLAFVKRR